MLQLLPHRPLRLWNLLLLEGVFYTQLLKWLWLRFVRAHCDDFLKSRAHKYSLSGFDLSGHPSSWGDSWKNIAIFMRKVRQAIVTNNVAAFASSSLTPAESPPV